MTIPRVPLSRALFAALLVAAPAFAQDITAGDLKILHLRAEPTPMPGANGAGFLIIQNAGKTADTLLSASSSDATGVEIHEMSMKGNVMHMRAITQGWPIPAGGSADLSDGGHLMLLSVTKKLVVGDRVPVTLVFAKAGKVSLELPVEDNQVPPMNHPGH